MKRIMRLVSMMFIRLLMVTLIVGCTNTSGGPNRQTNIDSGIQKRVQHIHLFQAWSMTDYSV